MGYAVDITIVNVKIPASNVAACLNAINALHTDEMLLHHAEIVDNGVRSTKQPVRQARRYGFVENPPEGGFSTLVDALTAWGYAAVELEDGSIEISEYIGEKWSYDELLFQAIAPFVADGGEIRVYGEDGGLWRYVFHDGMSKRQEGRVVYIDE